jgi:hypothetical protein
MGDGTEVREEVAESEQDQSGLGQSEPIGSHETTVPESDAAATDESPARAEPGVPSTDGEDKKDPCAGTTDDLETDEKDEADDGDPC